MNNMIIIENEINTIVDNLSNSSSIKKLNEEHSRAMKLMGLNTDRPLIVESTATPWKIWELPYFKGISKYLPDDLIDGARKNLSDFSDEVNDFTKKYGTSDDGYKKLFQDAHQWYLMNNVSGAKDPFDKIQMFINNKYAGALESIATNLFKRANDNTFNQLTSKIRSLKDETQSVGGNTSAFSTDGDIQKSLDDIDIDDVTPDFIDTRLTQLDNASTACKRERDFYKGKANGETDVTLKNSYLDIAKQFDELDALLQNKKAIYENMKNIVGDSSKTAASKIKTTGSEPGSTVEVAPSSMNNFQKLFWSSDFLNTLPRLIRDIVYVCDALNACARYKKIESDVAALINVMRANVGNIDPKKLYVVKEAEAFANRLNSAVVNEVRGYDFGFTGIKQLFGFGPADSVEQAYLRVMKIIDDLQGVTDAEKAQVKELIRTRYFGFGEGNEYMSVDEMGMWKGFTYLSDDIESASQIKLGGTTDDVSKAIEEKPPAFRKTDKFHKNLYLKMQSAFYQVEKNFGKYFQMLIVRGLKVLVIGISGGLRYVFRPLVKSGITLRGAAQSITNLYVAKLVVGAMACTFGFLFKSLMFAKQRSGVKDVTANEGQETGAQYFGRMFRVHCQKFVGQYLLNYPWHGVDFGWETVQKDEPISEWRKYKAELGVFKSYGTEFALEIKNWFWPDVVINQETISADVNKKVQDEVKADYEKNYGNLPPQTKENIKTVTKYTEFVTVIVDAKRKTYGADWANRVFFNSKLPIKPSIANSKTSEAYLKSNPFDGNKVTGFPFYCTTKLTKNKYGDFECKGKSYRLFYTTCDKGNNIALHDNDFNKNIFNCNAKTQEQLNKGKGVMYDKFYDKIVYLKDNNSPQNFNSRPSVGSNCTNIGDLTDLIK